MLLDSLYPRDASRVDDFPVASRTWMAVGSDRGRRGGREGRKTDIVRANPKAKKG